MNKKISFYITAGQVFEAAEILIEKTKESYKAIEESDLAVREHEEATLDGNNAATGMRMEAKIKLQEKICNEANQSRLEYNQKVKDLIMSLDNMIDDFLNK